MLRPNLTEQKMKSVQNIKRFADELGIELSRHDSLNYYFQYDSALIHLGLEQDREGLESIVTQSLVAGQVPQSPELTAWLLATNLELPLGAFGFKSGTIVLRQSLAAAQDLSLEQFRANFFTIAILADQFDDQIVARFGGKRSAELMREHDQQDFAWFGEPEA